MITLDPGLYNQQIVIRRKNVTLTAGEEVIGTPTSLGTFWARVEALQGRELTAAQQRWAEAKYRITMPYHASLTVQRIDEIVRNTDLLDILDVVDPTGLREQLVFICRDLVP